MTETVFVDGPAKTKIVTIASEKEDNKAGIIILVAFLSFFSLVVTAACIRYILLKKTQEKLDMEMKITRVQQELASDKKPIYGDVARDS